MFRVTFVCSVLVQCTVTQLVEADLVTKYLPTVNQSFTVSKTQELSNQNSREFAELTNENEGVESHDKVKVKYKVINS